MKKVRLIYIYNIILLFIFFISSLHAGEPSGAKAIFGETGEHETATIKTYNDKDFQKTKTSKIPAVEKEKYIGISYQVLLSKGEQFEAVSKSRIFNSGDRIKLLVTTNRSGYLSVINIGPTGNTHVLFKEYVNGRTPYTIPYNTNLIFSGEAGTEKMILMLSDAQQGEPKQNTVAQLDRPVSPTSYDKISLIEGSKDLVLEDNLETKYAVLSPNNNWEPENSSKDIMLETDSNGNNFSVVPISSIQGGKSLSLIIKLQHK